MTAENRSVLLAIDGAIARVSLNRPEALNALTVDLAQGFLQAMQEIAINTDIRVVLINGLGRAFCAGGDLSYLDGATADKARALIDPLHEAIELMTQLPLPVVAGVHGMVAGAGVSLALASDFILAAEGTRFNLAYTGIGTSPDASASWHLPRLVGINKSLELLLLSEPFDAAEALQLRVINRVHPAEQLQDACEAMAQKLAVAPTFALGQTKRLVRESSQATLKQQLDAERESFCACTQSQDFSTGIRAFLSRQKPSFTGR
ncbi:2-(1,2-epoxy-1,2-dihydrophenyl)acetyl-CoA isomerase [Pseudomonas sp. JAI111]|uniref:enoyl-CoA hydratase/isomerase family protein n=1 Tax=Pseudomonas sp. JAI111 TaxID=2735913 RepID=UPI0021684A13|nr:enoyl-CoA hydratase-related protein [Pseudomonas sp. JAI111]MCS3835666.1 2-(1,2-epoxy-1,2-dihydrophenyl)acetyl-CoA isomerase [Pseudomonas sp. JAI111]